MNTSFVIPSFNCQDTLAEAVDSIFNENFTSGDEVIIVDDASTDKTDMVAKELQNKHQPNILIIRNNENLGCPASRNVGIIRAKNELIFNLDSDNILAPASVARLKEALIRENADVAAFSKYYYFKKDTREITHKWIYEKAFFTLADILAGTVNPASGGNYLYRKEIWEKVGRYDEYGKGLHEAWGFSLKLLLNGAKFIVVPKTFYYHRYSHDSLFVRENKKSGEAEKITNKFIAPAIALLDEKSKRYVERIPDWFNHLETHPLYLKDHPLGQNGRIEFSSTLKQIGYWTKMFLKRA